MNHNERSHIVNTTWDGNHINQPPEESYSNTIKKTWEQGAEVEVSFEGRIKTHNSILHDVDDICIEIELPNGLHKDIWIPKEFVLLK